MTRLARDRAAVVTTAIVQMTATTPEKELPQAIEDYLRTEFSDIECQVAPERESDDA
jgi:hypothetical protein